MRLACLLLAAMLSGCGGADQVCGEAGWLASGRQAGTVHAPIADGLQGLLARCPDSHRMQAEASWRRGYALGLADYCQPASAWNVGRSGGGDELAQDCAQGLRQGFIANLRLGRRWHKLGLQRAELGRQLALTTDARQRNHLQNRLAKVEQEVQALAAIARMRGFLPYAMKPGGQS